MPTIQQILAARNVLIRESTALQRLGIPNRENGRLWLRNRLKWHLAALPRQVHLYAIGDVDRLKIELESLARLTPPTKARQ
jgi:hypothetical protein